MNVFILVQDSQDMKKAYAAMFAPFWNEIIKSLREEDFISNRLVEGNLLVDNVSKIFFFLIMFQKSCALKLEGFASLNQFLFCFFSYVVKESTKLLCATKTYAN